MKVERTPSFVDGIGGRGVLPEMWPVVRPLVERRDRCAAERGRRARCALLVERARVVAEGAGATPVACALAHAPAGRKIVCVVSGGNIDSKTLIELLGVAVELDSSRTTSELGLAPMCVLAPNLPNDEAEGADRAGRCGIGVGRRCR